MPSLHEMWPLLKKNLPQVGGSWQMVLGEPKTKGGEHSESARTPFHALGRRIYPFLLASASFHAASFSLTFGLLKSAVV